MSREQTALRILVAATLLLFSARVLDASGKAKDAPEVDLVYHALIPLGNETFAVQPWKSVLTVMASAESQRFEGWRREARGENRRLVDAAGQPVRVYPNTVDFRVSVGTRTHISGTEPFSLRADFPVNDYLLKLRFRMKIFHALHSTVVEPASVALIGVPSDLPYEERIYRASFVLREVPISDRIVLEVLAPTGERLCKFHLDLD
jgi:hypothetical protein